MPKAGRFVGVPGRCVEEKSDKNSRVFGVIKGRRKFFGVWADKPSYAAFSVVWGGVVFAKSGVVSAVRHFRRGV